MKQIKLFKRLCPEVVLTVLHVPGGRRDRSHFRFFCHGLRFIPDILNCIFIEIKRTSVQKSNKNEIFMARVKNSNCLKFCTQVDPSKTRKVKYFFPQICFYFREKRTFRSHPLESMDRVITGRKLNTFARFAFQRYYIQGNLINLCSFMDSSYSVKVSCVAEGHVVAHAPRKFVRRVRPHFGIFSALLRVFN